MADIGGSRAQRAFLVQLDQIERGESGADDGAAGRVEHVRSGEASRFGSVSELIAFMGRVLGEQGAADQDGPDA